MVVVVLISFRLGIDVVKLGPAFIMTGKVDANFALSNIDVSASSITSATTSVRKPLDRRLIEPSCQWHVPRRRRSLATPRLMRPLNATAVTVSAGPIIREASASVAVTCYLIPQVDIDPSAFGGNASSITISLESRRLDGPGCVGEQHFRPRAGDAWREHRTDRKLWRGGGEVDAEWIGRDGRVWWRRVDCTHNEYGDRTL